MVNFNIETFNNLYFNKHYSIRMIAEEFRCSPANILYHIKKNNITLRQRADSIKLSYELGRRYINGEDNPNYKDGKTINDGIGKRWSKHGITEEQFNRLKEKQNNKCAICDIEFIDTPSIDHCHITGNIRGLLCNNCNRGLGLLGDSIIHLTKALSYLMKANNL